jgi:hypothetical protein
LLIWILDREGREDPLLGFNELMFAFGTHFTVGIEREKKEKMVKLKRKERRTAETGKQRESIGANRKIGYRTGRRLSVGLREQFVTPKIRWVCSFIHSPAGYSLPCKSSFSCSSECFPKRNESSQIS